MCDDDTFLPAIPVLPAPSGECYDDLAGDDEEDENGDDADSEQEMREQGQRTILPLHVAPILATDCDDPDPFHRPQPPYASNDLDSLPQHLVCIYAIVAWLHLNFHLSRVACNAVLWAFALVVSAISSTAALPFVTLKSANRALGLDTLPITILSVCPACKEVYPASDSTPDACTKCSATLFKTSSTARGTLRTSRVPLLKFPTMSITSQLEAMLSTPGLEELLDSWRLSTREPQVYRDIFDGAITRNLLGPDGKRFFANDGPHHSRGPDGELRIGLAWGVDW